MQMIISIHVGKPFVEENFKSIPIPTKHLDYEKFVWTKFDELIAWWLRRYSRVSEHFSLVLGLHDKIRSCEDSFIERHLQRLLGMPSLFFSPIILEVMWLTFPRTRQILYKVLSRIVPVVAYDFSLEHSNCAVFMDVAKWDLCARNKRKYSTAVMHLVYLHLAPGF